MKGRFVSFFRAFLGLGIFLLITTSCEIGLGAAVDTEAPSAAIVSPAVKEAVGGDIVIRGTCEDDAKMDHLVIERFVNYDTRDEISEMRGRGRSSEYGIWMEPLLYLNPYASSFSEKKATASGPG